MSIQWSEMSHPVQVNLHPGRQVTDLRDANKTGVERYRECLGLSVLKVVVNHESAKGGHVVRSRNLGVNASTCQHPDTPTGGVALFIADQWIAATTRLSLSNTFFMPLLHGE